jgi:hypothetical protein
MNLFAVFQEGVYRHGCFGIFEREEEAKLHADHLARTDGDDYHEYQVVPFTLGQRLERDPNRYSPDTTSTEVRPTYRVKQGQEPSLD